MYDESMKAPAGLVKYAQRSVPTPQFLPSTQSLESAQTANTPRPDSDQQSRIVGRLQTRMLLSVGCHVNVLDLFFCPPCPVFPRRVLFACGVSVMLLTGRGVVWVPLELPGLVRR